jgi:hypothetical protein
MSWVKSYCMLLVTFSVLKGLRLGRRICLFSDGVLVIVELIQKRFAI